LAILLYVASEIGLQNLEKFGTHSEMSICAVQSVQSMGLTGGKLKKWMKEAVRPNIATLLFAHKVGVLELVLYWQGSRRQGAGGWGQNATDVLSLY
jgi:hypothetical protein